MPLGLRTANNVSTALAAAAASGATSLQLVSGGGTLFPTLASGEYCFVTLQDGTTQEVARVTQVTGDILVCDALNNAFAAGATVEIRATAEEIDAIVQGVNGRVEKPATPAAGEVPEMTSAGDLVNSGVVAADISQRSKVETFTGHKTLVEVSETVYTLTGTVIDPANGTIQIASITADTTYTLALTVGQAVTLQLTTGGAVVTWADTIRWVGGTAPALDAAAENIIVFWHDGTNLNGLYVGTL